MRKIKQWGNSSRQMIIHNKPLIPLTNDNYKCHNKNFKNVIGLYQNIATISHEINELTKDYQKNNSLQIYVRLWEARKKLEKLLILLIHTNNHLCNGKRNYTCQRNFRLNRRYY